VAADLSDHRAGQQMSEDTAREKPHFGASIGHDRRRHLICFTVDESLRQGAEFGRLHKACGRQQ
jgi:hypothetical protein